MASTEPLSRIMHLANIITASVTKIDEALRVKGLPSPSFNEDTSFSRPAEVAKEHDIVLDATAELHDLLLEPLNLMHRHGGHNNSVCLQTIAEFHIADMVPPYGRVSFGEIAKQTPMTEQMTARILRHGMTMRIFCEPEPGMVAHTAASKLLNHSAANDWLEGGTQEMWPAATKLVEALRKWPASQEPNETGYSLAHNSTEGFYAIYAKDPERAARWARGMGIFSQRPQFDLSYVTDHYDWHSLGEAHVVDVGGSQGHVSIALARRFSNLQFTVQDMKQAFENATIPEELQDRVKFMAHDIFAPQTLKGVDMYFLRWILHNWSDKYCIQILRALTTTMKPRARVLVQETLMPEPGTMAVWKEKSLRATDLNMAAAFNAQERTVAEFEALFRQADSGYMLTNVIQPSESALGMLEFVWGWIS
ncbi:S-adenosyl-L-methionine-dependent methyltransferase [Hypoxylon sp. FL1284]|nr:S-adenosyl-L-methionine-dependent methyltransferase [Hypoxylon sp. FL1284]